LAKTPSKPRYLQLAEDLRGEILSGMMPAEAFPTESVLCTRFGVSRFTVREALRQLQAGGLIHRRRGSGTVVRPTARDGALHQPLSNVGEILQYAADTQVTYAIGGASGVPPKLAAEIGLPTGKGWSHFRGVRTRDGKVAIASVDAYIHPSFAAVAARIDLTGDATIFQQLERLADVRIARVTQDIQAIPAGRDAGAALGIRPRDPALRILRCYLDANARVVEVSVSVHPGDRFAYAMHIEVEG
jgi:GntR family transcriptional regulator